MNFCVTCGENFGSVQSFDRHRVGKHEYTFMEGLSREPSLEDGRRCLDLDEMASLRDKQGRSVFERNARGAWSIAPDMARARLLRNTDATATEGVSP